MAFGTNGLAVPGALANFYVTGGTTRAATYSDTGLTTEHANPVVADGAGRFPVIYLDDAVTYRLIITDADGGSLGYDVDPYAAPVTAAELAANVTAAQAAQTGAELAESNAEGYASALSDASKFVWAAESYGQSLGRRRAPKITTAVSSKLTTFNGGDEPDDFGTFSNDAHFQDVATEMASLVAYSVPDDKEGWGPGLGYSLGLDSLCDWVDFDAMADGSRHWRELKDGSGRWANMLAAFRRKYAIRSATYASANIRPLFFWTQGEADADTTSPGGGGSEAVVSQVQYLAILEQVRDKLRFDLSNIFDRAMTTLPIFVTPLVSNSPAGTANVQASYIDAIASGGIIILPPHYQFYTEMETDGVHLGGQGRRYYAELAASVAKRVLRSGQTYQAPHVTSSAINGAAVDCTFLTPDSSDLVIDTSTFADPALNTGELYGIRYYDDSAAAYVDISSITVSGRVMTVTPSVTPAASDRIEIAQQPWPGGTQTADKNPRSNIRCGLSVSAEDGTTLYHYALPQTVTV